MGGDLPNTLIKQDFRTAQKKENDAHGSSESCKAFLEPNGERPKSPSHRISAANDDLKQIQFSQQNSTEKMCFHCLEK